jgi:hypothetical protein
MTAKKLSPLLNYSSSSLFFQIPWFIRMGMEANNTLSAADPASKWLISLSRATVVLNSMINFFIFFIFVPKFRQQFFGMFCGGKEVDEQPTSMTSNSTQMTSTKS